ncbi:MAG: hypothetical protein HYZ72_02295 [Deltaproteobacteria bacterium]|nr:hypothetical protein [Deltaproteobacteria bacterium]
MAKPFDPAELRSRLRVGERILLLERTLAQKISDLEEATAHVTQLQGLLPICMHCKQVRDSGECWHALETHIEEHSQVLFSHALCDACLATYYPEEEDDSEEPKS